MEKVEQEKENRVLSPGGLEPGGEKYPVPECFGRVRQGEYFQGIPDLYPGVDIVHHAPVKKFPAGFHPAHGVFGGNDKGE